MCRLSPLRLPPLLLVCVVLSLGQADNAKKSTTKGRAVQSVDLTTGEKKAVEASSKIETDTLVMFDKDGDIKKRETIDPHTWSTLREYVAKICSGPVPISSKCVRCENGEIICANVPKKR